MTRPAAIAAAEPKSLEHRTPTVQAAFPTIEDAATLGLDRPMRLLGRRALPPEALASATGLDHVPELRPFLASACRRQAALGRDFYHHPPLALVGPPGFGRGLLARRIAEASGVPLVEIDGSGLRYEAGAGLDLRDAPPPALAMALTGCANPIVLLDLTDDVPAVAVRRLAAMTDPNRAGRWSDERLGAIFDLSSVSWIVQASRASPALQALVGDAGLVIETPLPRGPAEDLRRLAIAAQVAGAARGRPDPHLAAALFELLGAAFGRSVQPARKLFEHAVAHLDRLGPAT